MPTGATLWVVLSGHQSRWIVLQIRWRFIQPFSVACNRSTTLRLRFHPGWGARITFRLVSLVTGKLYPAPEQVQFQATFATSFQLTRILDRRPLGWQPMEVVPNLRLVRRTSASTLAQMTYLIHSTTQL